MTERNFTTARYRILTGSGGNRYRFYCDASGMAMCTTAPVRGRTQIEELHLAWDAEGRQHFNQCVRCGRWVSDPMYNADRLQCVDCTPWQKQQHYCTRCGRPVPVGDSFCIACGIDLHREEGRL